MSASLTKIYGLGSLRAGWAVLPAGLVHKAHIVNDHLGVEAPFLADEVSLLALRQLPRLRERAHARRQANLPLVRRCAKEHGLRWYEPAGGFIVWLGLPEGIEADALEAGLRDRYDTQITPGSFFGASDHIRLGFGGATADVEAGLECLGRALGELS